METEELTKLVDGIYKNILDKFNPGARQLINAGKAYLKALHGAAAASRVYVEALSRLARQAQLGTWGGSQDVGSALMRIVEVYKEIQEQEMNILKAFYVDLLVPLETNLEKDTKVVQSEQKKFLQQHKTRSETYSKAAATMKKQRKKSRGASKNGLAMGKELKNMQILEEEKSKLDAFCEQSLKNAMTQERRRYGFVLERQCSLAKHYASFHEVALAALHPSVDEWREVAGTREYLPQSVEDMFVSRLRQVSFWPEDEENCGSEITMSSQLRKTRSMDSSCLELRLGPPPPPGHPPASLHHGGAHHLAPALSRAKSEANLHASSLSLGPEVPETPPRPRSMAPASRSSVGGGGGGGSSTGTGVSTGGWGDSPLARALFAYLSSGENQLSFLEGDLIALMGDRQKGWQFGENLRTQSSGWFPLAYTEIIVDDNLSSPSHGVNNGRSPEPRVIPPCKPPPSRPPVTPSIDELSLSHGGAGNNNSGNISATNGTPTNVPKSNSSHSIATPTGRQPKSIRPSGTLPTMLAGGRRVQPPVPPVPPPQAVTSLHSSNDSGFSNEPPVQPDIDYSDDEAMRQRRRKARVDRVEPADRGKQYQQHQQHQQQQQQQRQSREDENNSSSKEWENNDSWKTIPRDEKNWPVYRKAMDIWESTNNESGNDRTESGAVRYTNGGSGGGGGGVVSGAGRSRRAQQESKESHVSKEYSSRAINSDCENSGRDKRQKKSDGSRKSDYDQTRGRVENERSSRYTNGDDRPRESSRRKREDDRRESTKRDRPADETEDDENEEHNDDEDTYETNGGYKDEYDAKKYYEDRGGNHRDDSSRRYREENRRDDDKYDNEKSDSESTTSDSEDTSTITIPETGRKVEHIAQKLEQTAQKYAREHSPPKFVERRRGGGTSESEYKQHPHQQQQQQQQQMIVDRDEKPPPSYERAYENSAEARSRHSQRFERDRGYPGESTKQQSRSNTSTLGTGTGTYERTFEKNPERKRNVGERASTSRRFEQRPRPPFEDAPERPVEQRPIPSGHRERRYSDKEEIYGETGRYSRDPGTLEKDRGYESNFETKLERNKVIEKVQQVAYRSRADGGAENPRIRDNSVGNSTRNTDINDTNNNTLKDERKTILPRQATALAHLVQTGRTFDFETKSPKLVKRTKSFWRFRRDSDVLEGMALWQHRSLVDIPKMLKRESMEDKSKNDLEITRKVTPEASMGSGQSIGNESRSSDNTITNEQHHPNENNHHHHQDQRDREQRQDEPKPAERIHVPDKSEYFESDFPTPAERPKLVERSEYRMHREERTLFIGNISRKAIIEKERKRSMEAKRNMVVAELKENNVAKKGDRRNKTYGEDDDGLMQNFSETEASDEESTYSCIIVKDQNVAEKTLLPRTKLRRDSDRERDKNTCGPWYDLWGVDNSVPKKKNK